MDLDGVGILETGVAYQSSYVVAAKLCFDDFDFTGHDGLCTEDKVRHRDAVFDDVSPTVECTLAEAAQVEDRLTQHFAWNRAGMHTHATDKPLTIDNRNFLTELGGADRAFLAGRAAADYYEIVFVSLHAQIRIITLHRCGGG